MLDRPTDLPADREAEFEAFVRDVREATFDAVEDMLTDLDEPALAQRVYELAFEANDVLPGRDARPDLSSAVLAATAADAHGLDDGERDALVGFAVAIQEYYDVLDDLVDGDVADGHEAEVQVVAQALLPLALDRLHRLGPDAVAYWTGCALDLVCAPFAEVSGTPTAEAYRELVDRQSVLLGFVPGVAAVAADRDEADVDRAEALGRALYRHQQFARDLEQHLDGDDDPWNAAALLGEESVVERLEAWREDVETYAEPYPEPASRRLRALVALDLEEWRRSLSDR